MAFLLNFGPVKKQVIQCFTFLDQLVIINQKGEIYVEKINLLLSNQYLLCDKKNDRKFKSRDVCFLKDASPRVCTKDVLEIPFENQDTDLEINQIFLKFKSLHRSDYRNIFWKRMPKVKIQVPKSV